MSIPTSEKDRIPGVAYLIIAMQREILTVCFSIKGSNYFRIKTKGGTDMNCNANKCIECTVQQCAYHCDTENFCSLDKILVGTHEANPTVDQCTDCKSFRKK